MLQLFLRPYNSELLPILVSAYYQTHSQVFSTSDTLQSVMALFSLTLFPLKSQKIMKLAGEMDLSSACNRSLSPDRHELARI
jgi:hypothetical protein